VDANPLHVYVAACRLQFEMGAKAAAEQWKRKCPRVYLEITAPPDNNRVYWRNFTLPDWDDTTATRSYLPETAQISAGAHFRLLRFVRNGGDHPSFVEPERPRPLSSSRLFNTEPDATPSPTTTSDPPPVHGCEREAQEAARCAADQPIEDVYVPEMEFMSADVYHRLLKYCHLHRSAVTAASASFRGHRNDSEWWWAGCLTAIAASIVQRELGSSQSYDYHPKSLSSLISESRTLESKIRAAVSKVSLLKST
jgi:hypothetical protein